MTTERRAAGDRTKRLYRVEMGGSGGTHFHVLDMANPGSIEVRQHAQKRMHVRGRAA